MDEQSQHEKTIEERSNRMILNFGKYKAWDIADVPDTYLDWLMGEPWFIENKYAEEVAKELAIRKRSHYYVEDDYGRTLEDL